MRWSKKITNVNDTRIVNRFAWYPTTCPQTKITYWLEWVKLFQVYGYDRYRYYIWKTLKIN